MISTEQAENLVSQNIPSPIATHAPLEGALGYWLAGEVKAERDYPPFDRITHDGIALAFAAYAGGRRDFAVMGYAAAGMPAQSLAGQTQCFEVATGAPLPEGCDTVIPYE